MLWLPGQPVPCPRVKVGRWGAYYGKAYSAWLPAAKDYAKDNWEGGFFDDNQTLIVRLEFKVARAASHYGTGKNSMKLKAGAEAKYPVPNGDIDNYAKGPLDALSGVVYGDDKQIIELVARKAWTTNPDEQPGVHIEVELLRKMDEK